MQKSYTSNYLKTYFWQTLSVFTNLASMFIVIPMITDNKVVYGIYSICVSMSIFLSYADLGFVSAGIKYAGEYFAKGEKTEEFKLHGFTSFILFVFVLIFFLIFLIFSFNPSFIITDINSSNYSKLASQLLLIQAFSSLIVVLQRFASGVCQVRIEQFISQGYSVAGSVMKIVSVYFFFGNHKYDIVEYFLFTKIVDLVVVLISIRVIIIRYKIPILLIFKSFRFDKKLFNKTKKLAFSSIFTTFCWVAFYELDLIFIGKFIGATSVAVFALAFTFSNFFRTLSSTIFSPFQNRYNHFVGLNDIDGLKNMIMKVILFSMPILILVIISVIILSNNIVICWAGNQYFQSGFLLSVLSINFMFSFIVIPTANYFVATEKINALYWSSFIMIIVFWCGVYLSINYWGVKAFAIFKVVSGGIVFIFCLRHLLKFLNLSLIAFIKNTIYKLLIPIIIQILFLFLIKDFLPIEKGKVNLLIVVIIGGIGTLLGFISLYLTSEYYKKEYKEYLLKILNPKKNENIYF